MGKKELVSIIMPCYNSEKYISEAIDSVRRQTYKNWELIIVDDSSQDDSKKIIQEYCEEDNRIKLITLEVNRGTAVARNTGIKVAKGIFIAFLDSDDTWYTDKLKTQIEYMITNKHNFCCTYYEKIDSYGKKLNKTVKLQNISNYWDVLKNNPGNSTVVYA